MKNLEDDIYSFGFIMLDSLVKPPLTLKKNEFLLKDLVSPFPLTSVADYSVDRSNNSEYCLCHNVARSNVCSCILQNEFQRGCG